MKPKQPTDQEKVIQGLDKMINFFETYKGRKPERIALSRKDFKIFQAYQRAARERAKLSVNEFDLNFYRDVEIYEIRR